MGADISAELAEVIAKAQVFGSSDNIRHGRYKFIIKNIRAEKVEVEGGLHKFVFWELEPYESLPNPQIEGDHVDYPDTKGPLKDDGTKPNLVGTNCALKVDFDGNGARSAPANSQAPILALFNKQSGQLSEAELAVTFVDLARPKDVHKGDMIGFDTSAQKPIIAEKDKRAQPARGMVIGCTTSAKKKKKATDKGAYVTKLNWFCIAPIGTGENSLDKVAERRAKIEANQTPDDDEEESSSVPAAPASGMMPQMPVGVSVAPPPPAGMQVPATPPSPTAPSASPAPPAPVVAFVPSLPWKPLPNHPIGNTPDTRWFWSDPQAGGSNLVKSEAQLLSGQ